MKSREARDVWPVALAAAVGGGGLVGQTVLVRELMVSYYGTELALAAVLSCWLLLVPLGALASTAVLRRGWLSAPVLLRWAAAALAFGLPVQFACARLVRPLFGADAGQFLTTPTMLAGAALAAVPTAFWVGFFFPPAAWSAERTSSLAAEGISRVYVAEALGSAAVGALLSFLVLGRVSPTATVLACSVVLLACTATSLLVPPRRAASVGRRAAAVALLALAALLSASCLMVGGKLEGATAAARWATFSRFRLIADRETRYQHLALGERAGAFALFQDGYHTAMFPEPVADAQRAALLLTQHPDPADVLVIGGGLGGLCQQMLAPPVRRLDYVEPDPALVGFLYNHLPAELRDGLRDERFAAFRTDGRRFVRLCAERDAVKVPRHPAGPQTMRRSPAGRYDLVVVNVGDPVSAAGGRFYTVEFCRRLRQVLRPGGTVAFCGLTGSENYLGDGPILRYAASLYATVRAVFPRVIARPGDELCLFAGAGASSDTDLLVERFERHGLQPEALKYGLELAEFPPERVRWLARRLKAAAPEAPVNADARPVLFTLFLAVQRHYGAGVRPTEDEGDLWQRLRAVPGRWLWLPLLVLPVLVLAVRALAGRCAGVSVAAAAAVFTGGVFGLAAEMLIVYRYQTSFGFIYRDIAVVVGLFMLGLAGGGRLSGRRAVDRARSLLLVVEGSQATLVLALPAVLGLLSSSPHAFMALSAAAGFLTGLLFPLAARVSLGEGRSVAGVAGVLDAADHLGALAGAACTGLLLVPAVGLVHTGALAALLKCAGLLGLVIALPGGRAD
ncbi:MAG: hypothetical protein R6V05_11380 [Candidatus Brocadiia bacterium]